jgi:hypothetical protein
MYLFRFVGSYLILWQAAASHSAQSDAQLFGATVANAHTRRNFEAEIGGMILLRTCLAVCDYCGTGNFVLSVGS